MKLALTILTFNAPKIISAISHNYNQQGVKKKQTALKGKHLAQKDGRKDTNAISSTYCE
jgi:hypothetical protein